MALHQTHAGAVCKELLLIVGGLLFVAAMLAVGWLTRSDPGTTPSPPAVAPQPASPPVKPVVRKRPPTEQTPKTARAQPVAPLDDAFRPMLQQYQEHVIALDEQTSAYRNSLPVFAHYKEAFRTHVLPLMLKGEKARQELARLQPGGPTLQDEEAWQAQHAPYVHAMLGPYLAAVGAEVYQLAMSGKMPVAVEDVENLGQWVAALQQAAGPEGDTWRGNPYEPGTFEYTRFEAYLGESAGLFAAAMAQVLLPVPPEFEAQHADLEAERQELIAAAPPDQVTGLPQEYVDPFTRELAADFGQFTTAQESTPDTEEPAEPEEFQANP